MLNPRQILAFARCQDVSSGSEADMKGASRDVHRLAVFAAGSHARSPWPAGPFNRLGEFPAEQPNDLPLSPTAQAFYRSGPTLWQRYTSFWLTSLLNRIAFFVIPVVLALIPVIGFALTSFRWLPNGLRHGSDMMSALGQKQTYAPQKAMSALPSIATAKADSRTRSCLLYP
jgi:hypothetical protein